MMLSKFIEIPKTVSNPGKLGRAILASELITGELIFFLNI